MKQYYIGPNELMMPSTLGKIINDFELTCLPTLQKRYDYFLGKHMITKKVATDDGKPCNKVVTNYVRNIIDTYEGYSVGVPVTYQSDSERFEEIQDVLDYNDIADQDSDFFRDALIFGRSFEICYIDEDKKQRFTNLNPLTVIPVYSNTLSMDLLYVIRYWQEQLSSSEMQSYIVEVYDEYEVTTYRSDIGFSSFTQIDKRPHYYDQVPISIMSLNKEEEGIADQVFSLQDAYNSLLSDSIDDFDSFCDAYMVIKGMTAEEEDIKSMKEHRVLLMDSDASAEYLTKDVSTQEIQNLLTTCESKIREISACPNFSSEEFNTSSGIAIRYRMMSMENNVSAILNNFKKALQKRIELLASVIKLSNDEVLWRTVDIIFHRNIPTDLSDIADQINKFRGLVSDETLLGQIPFIQDVDEELNKIAEEEQRKSDLFNEHLLGQLGSNQETETAEQIA